MKERIDFLINRSSVLLDCKVLGILLNQEELAELREDLDTPIIDTLKTYRDVLLLVDEVENLSILNEYKGGRYCKVSFRGIGFIGESSKPRYTELLANTSLQLS